MLCGDNFYEEKCSRVGDREWRNKSVILDGVFIGG